MRTILCSPRRARRGTAARARPPRSAPARTRNSRQREDRMANWRRITGAAGLVVGATAAGAGALVAAERIAVSRIRSRTGHHPGDEPFGTLRGRELTVLAQDGVPLHVEINGPDAAPVTIIFCHGYTVNQDCWHFQRRD